MRTAIAEGMTTMNALRGWKKATRSAEATNCVEVGRASNQFGIRDTKNRDGGTLVIDRPTFNRFIAATKASQLTYQVKYAEA
ncbi:DUF397 domain-containing protein [Actinoalloteichus hymeniacidonis]|uniref:DUF397 family protein n=1 Tax=Actinoalloteichus hymeniacidonis TaxID=340345 RepID=A0AAC9HMS3_9PSEU|nr:DUF397 domain-containing protein [Actinoalloteichus hymeniacidonis]AOS62051.1 putative DUF397 family protein [Actinoalloteichus hymeniacidonis]MBB5909927.1 hypothetical protein [Actinoalloteichus hymeniacidonis]